MAGIDSSFLETVDTLFHPYLAQQGSHLMHAVTQVPVTGATFDIRQQDVGPARFRNGQGEQTQFTTLTFDRRRLTPRAFDCSIMLDDIDMVKQGTPDPGLIAQQAGNSCGQLLDQIIIQGIGGASYSVADSKNKYLTGAENITAGANKEVLIDNYDKTNTISWNDCTLSPTSDNSNGTNAGLSVSKVSKAIRKLREKHADATLFLVGSEFALSTLRADLKMSNLQYNIQPAMVTQQIGQYAGISEFIPSEFVGTGKSCVKLADGTYGKNATDVEYAYVFGAEYINLGCSVPLHLESGKDVTRYNADILFYKGAYDCVRLFEDAVVRIEILRSLSGLNATAFVS